MAAAALTDAHILALGTTVCCHTRSRNDYSWALAKSFLGMLYWWSLWGAAV